MKKLVLVSAFSLLAAGASAQTADPGTQPPIAPPADTMMPRDTTMPPTGAQPTTPTPPIAGANSFTEDQAKSHIEKMGYTNVTDLKKDEKGIWHGHAMKGGQTVPVSLDYKGNVVSK